MLLSHFPSAVALPTASLQFVAAASQLSKLLPSIADASTALFSSVFAWLLLLLIHQLLGVSASISAAASADFFKLQVAAMGCCRVLLLRVFNLPPQPSLLSLYFFYFFLPSALVFFSCCSFSPFKGAEQLLLLIFL
ncbi:hypothetical protein M9H77_04312 [Catharanthus roseus]|uniref:Uncharacterized protein n=1 Tax=Catharanthus roseus TaxID=4058 RepID=A0ACC0CE66_CATRO|nr:hypothetical protein M9H77_04312 [Catharanthus roseus]